MKTFLRIALLACIGVYHQPPASPTPTASEPTRVAIFSCADSLPRADGSPPTSAQCEIAIEYCYEANGGPPVSHGAQCRALPKSSASCADLMALLGAGASCSGTQDTGLRVQFAFP